MMTTMMKYWLITLILMMAVQTALAVKIADISTLQGQRENRLMTVGLVVGRSGTGDGGKFLPAIQPLISFLQHFGSERLDLETMRGVKNVALVSVEAQVGANGAREGQQLDVAVSAIGSAKSLKGGRLLLIPMMGPNKADTTVYALASGPVSVDPSNPTTGSVKNGATMEQDVVNTFIQNNTFMIVIDDAHDSWSMASTIAETINEAVSVQRTQQQIARALDPKTVIVVIPNTEVKDPANFIAWIQSLPLLMPEKTAQVTINAKTGTIVADDTVTISPVTISYKGMTISTEMLVKQLREQAEKNKQPFEMPEFVNLSLMIDAMNYLTLPVEDRIAIIRELARTGNLQGQLVEQP
jgi:flagellar P-ring protein precursor FlgI